MMTIGIDLIKKLRDQTGAGVADCRQALEEAGGDLKKAAGILRAKGAEIADKKKDRVAAQGLVVSYIHSGGKIGALVEVACETDFVARTDEFVNLARELAMQVAAMNPENVEEFLKEVYIRDNSQTIAQLVKSAIGKLGENIKVNRFVRFEIGNPSITR